MSGSTSTPRRAGTPAATTPGIATGADTYDDGARGPGPHGNGVCGTGHSNDRLVSATIDGDGYPVALDIREQATALGAARLRDRVLEALRRAHDDVTAHVRPPVPAVPAGAAGDGPEQMVSEATRAVRQIAEQFEDVRRQLFSMARSGSE